MRPPSLSFRGAKRRGNLGEAVAISPMAFLRSGRVLRDCHVGLRPPRNDKSGGQHRFNGGRYGSGVPSRDCHVASLLAMTNRRCVPFLRWLVPNGSAFPRLPRRFAPRNDKSDSLLHPEGRKGKPESAFLPCHCEEGASPTRQSQAGTIEFAGAFLCSGVYCEIAASAYGLLAMTRQGNTAVHQRLSAVELPRTGRSVSALQAGNIQGVYFMA